MRTVAGKIWLGCLAIVVFGTITMLAAYRGLVHVQKEMRHLTDVREPIKEAAQELEINLKETALGALAYLSAPNPIFEEMIRDDEADFQQFHNQYLRLATTQQEKEFAASVAQLYEQFKQQVRELMARRDRQTVTFTDVLARLEETDRVFDQQLPMVLSRRSPEDQHKRDAVSSVDEGIDAIRMRVATYRWSRVEEYKLIVEQQIVECQDAFQLLKTFDWAAAEQSDAIRSAERAFTNAVEKVRQVLVDEDEIQAGIARFIDLRHQMDALLDDQIQPFAASLAREPRQRADSTVASVVIQIAWLIGLFLVIAGAVSLLLTRAVMRPLRSLASGTEALSQGNLAVRVSPVSRDEFAKLAGAFNSMVDNLRETLVSKDLLAKSEQKLQKTVQALQEEIIERVRKEEERVRLQASLRRAEMLSAMGTLVAGVAHQVRNPLFGMPSVLDAMEAKLGNRPEYQRYVEVLRGEASRVTSLMQELMEYGGASSGEQAPSSIGDVIRDAVRACQMLAEKAQVKMDERIECSMSAAPIDRPRLQRAFENLLQNAIQHSAANGVVTIGANQIQDVGRTWIEVNVEDSGSGFREEDLPMVFEPFFSRRPGGTGLGLALVERIVKSHGGHVIAANRPEGGAVMTVRLPIECMESDPTHRTAGNGA